MDTFYHGSRAFPGKAFSQGTHPSKLITLLTLFFNIWHISFANVKLSIFHQPYKKTSMYKPNAYYSIKKHFSLKLSVGMTMI
jgi:hypothetical protein